MPDYTDRIKIVLDKIPTDALDKLYERLDAVKGAGVLLAAEMASGTVTTAEYASVSKELAADQRALLQAIEELESQYNAVAAAQQAATQAALDQAQAIADQEAAILAAEAAADAEADAMDALAVQLNAATVAFDAFIEAQILADEAQREAAKAAAQEAEALAAVAEGRASAIAGTTEYSLAEDDLTASTYELVGAMEKSEQQQIAEINAFRAAMTAIEDKTQAQAKAIDIDKAGTTAATRNQTAFYDSLLASGHASGDLTEALVATGGSADGLARHVGRGSNLGMAMFALSQGIEDAQYGFHSIINNIPMVVMAIGGFSQGAMVASAAISMAAVAVNLLLPKIQELTKALDGGVPRSSIEGIRELENRAKELRKEFEKSPIKLSVDEEALERLDKRISELRKNATGMREKMEGKTEEESDTAKEVEKIFKAPNAKKAIEAIREDRVKKGTMLNGGELEEIERARQKIEVEEAKLKRDEAMGIHGLGDAYALEQDRERVRLAKRAHAETIHRAGKTAEERMLAEINKKMESGKEEDIDALAKELEGLGSDFGKNAARDLLAAKPENRQEAAVFKHAKEIADKELLARAERSKQIQKEFDARFEAFEKEADEADEELARKRIADELALLNRGSAPVAGGGAIGGGIAFAPLGGVAGVPAAHGAASPSVGFMPMPAVAGAGGVTSGGLDPFSFAHSAYASELEILMRSRSGLDAKEKRLRDKMRKKAGTHMRDADENLLKVGDPELEAATDELVLAEHDRQSRKAQALAAKRRARHTAKKKQRHTLNPYADRQNAVNRRMTVAELEAHNRDFEARRKSQIQAGLQARGLSKGNATAAANQAVKQIGKSVVDNVKSGQLHGLKADAAFLNAMQQFNNEQQAINQSLISLKQQVDALKRGSQVRQGTLLNMGR